MGMSFVTTNKQDEEAVSTACILLFGKYPQKFFPRARTRFIKYEGIDEKVGAEMNVIKDVTFEGTILNQVEKTIEFIETQVREHTFLGQHGQFVTLRDYPKFVIQEMTVNSVCHRAYSIKGTEIQIKMFDDRLVFESPGKMPGMVKPDNIRYTHFSRNPKIAAFLKAYHYVKEFGEGLDRICREQEANGAKTPSFRTDEFILKITVPKVTEKVAEKVTVNDEKVAEKVIETEQNVTEKVIEKHQKVIEKLIEKAAQQGDRLTENRISILRLMMDDPYISKAELSKYVGISENSISRNIEAMRGKYLRRVGPDKGGFWEIIEE
jgi:ATP-dependent DNA helicase RecG